MKPTDPQNQPDPHQITAENAYLYSPDAQQPKGPGRFKRFWDSRTRPQKVLLIASTVIVVFSALMIGLSIQSSNNTPTKTSQNSLTSSQQTTDSSQSGQTTLSVDEDADQNGIPDEEEADRSSDVGVSWWQRILNTVSNKTSSNATDDTEDTASTAGDTNDSGMTDDSLGYIEDDIYTEDGDVSSTEYDTSVEDIPASVAAQLATSGNGSRFTIASWNVFTNNKQDIGDRSKQILAKAQVLGLQEVNSNKVKKVRSITCSGCAYEAYLPSKADRFPIVWDKGYFSKVDAGYMYMVKPAGPYQERYAVWVKLRNKVTGKTIYAVNTHLPRGVEGNVDAKLVESYKKHMANLVTLLKSKQKDNIPIFVTGDFNVNYRKDGCSTSWKPCDKLGALGIKSGWKVTKLAGVSSKQGTHSTGNRLIDYVFLWDRSDVTVNSTYIFGGNKNGWGGSDHKPSFVNVTIK